MKYFTTWIFIANLIVIVSSQNDTHCSQPNRCEYFFDIDNPESCFCSGQCRTNGIRRLCFYTSHLKKNCDPSCQISKLDSACQKLCCSRDCEPDPWQEWSSCYGPCGNKTGIRNRMRIVSITKTSQCDGKPCPPLNETETCKTDCCFVDCQWSQWSVWGECNNTCGQGFNKRQRTVYLEASCGGKGCSGKDEEMKPCVQFKNVNCLMDSWSAWGKCQLGNGYCGNGTETRTRSIINPSSCQGIQCSDLNETRPCQGVCCQQNCSVSPWTAWSFCNSSCGNGYQTRTRTILINGECGGIRCPTNYLELKACSKLNLRNCTVSPWTTWSICSSTCGTGYQISTRSILSDEACGGSCNFPLMKNQTCESYSENLDCAVSDWSDWSTCVRDCYGGSTYRTRSIITYPQCKGSLCPELQENTTCTKPCSQLCNNGTCSCRDGFYLFYDNITCLKVHCDSWPNNEYELPNSILNRHYGHVTFTCNSNPIEAGDVCVVNCADSKFVLRGDVANYTCQSNGQFNYQKMYCGPPNYPPTDIQIDNTKIEEDSSDNRCFGTFSTIDANGDSDKFFYSLESNFQNRLKISGKQLCLNYRPKYKAPNNTWDILVRTTDSGNLSFTKWINIFIKAANLSLMSCELEGSKKIPENVGQPYLVGYLVFTDPQNEADLISPSIIDSDSPNFEIFYNLSRPVNQYGIQVSSIASTDCLERGGPFCALNYEVSKQHSLTIRAVYMGLPPRTSYFDIILEILNMNDGPTSVFINVTEIPENMKPGEKIATLNIADEDNLTQSYQFKILGGDTEYLAIDNKTNLMLMKPINYENSSKKSLEIIVQGIDNGTPPMNVTSNIVLNITNVNEPPGIFMVPNSKIKDGTFFIHVPENNEIGAKIATIYVKDPDLNSEVFYRISGGSEFISIHDHGCISDYLQIESTSCQVDIISKLPFNYETLLSIPFNFTMTDNGNLTETNEFVVVIDNINESPINITFLDTNSTSIEIKENQSGINISFLFALDEDQDSKHVFRIVEDVGGCFEIINGNLMKLKDKQFLDYESPRMKNVVLVEVTDNGIPPRSFRNSLTITAKDINEPPTDILLTNNKISESATEETLVGVLSAIDPDFNETFIFSMKASSNMNFQVTGTSLKVSSVAKLNFELKPEEIITIEVSDKENLIFTKVFRIFILNSNDPPSKPYLTNNIVVENASIGTIIGTLISFDEDVNQTVSYELVKGFENFAILPGGILTTKAVFNYEEANKYEVIILFYDNGVPSISSTSPIDIYISNINEKPYLEFNEPMPMRVPENVVRTIGFLKGFDSDVNETLRFTCTSFNYSEPECPIKLENILCNKSSITFGTECSVEMTVVKPLNYENVSNYKMEIEVKDNQGFKSTLIINMIVEDKNEPISRIELNGMPIDKIRVKENEQNIKIGKISFYDPDLQQNHEMKILETDAVDKTEFLQISDWTIQTLGNFSFNFEKQSTYKVKLQINDNSSDPITTEVLVPIIVEDLNERPTNINLSAYEISENMPNETLVANINAFDPDNLVEERQKLSFALIFDELDALTIVGTELKIKNSEKINFENQRTMKIAIQVADNGLPSLSFNREIILNILDKNDCPKVLGLTDAFLNNNASKDTIVKNISFSDEDQNQSHVFTLKNVQPDTYTPFFSFNSLGQLIKTLDDPILVQHIRIMGEVMDNGSPPMSSSFQFNILVFNLVIQCSSELVLNSKNAEKEKILENATVGSNVGYLKIHLNESFPVQEILLQSKDAQQYFSLENMTCHNFTQENICTFQLILIRDLDFETKNNLVLEIILILDGGTRAIAKRVLEIADVNEKPLDIASSPGWISIAENMNFKELICTFTMTDPDKDDKGNFEMLSNINGVILFSNGSLYSNGNGFDYETNNSVVLLIKGTDKGNLSLEKQFILTILNENEAPDINNVNLIQIFENITDNQVISTFNVTDPDFNQTYNIRIIQNFKDNFKINQNQLMTNLNHDACFQNGLSCGFNFESYLKKISLILIIEDSGLPKMSKEFEIFIIIMDSNDPPVDIKLSKTTVNENEPANTLIGHVKVVDEDYFEKFSCYKVSDVRFYVDPNLDLRTTEILDFEKQPNIEITLECFDSHNISVIQKFMISVKDVNEDPYRISTQSNGYGQSLSINENVLNGEIIGFIYSQDPDFNEFLNVTCESTFVICQNIQCSIQNVSGSICQTEIKVANVSFFNFEQNSELVFNVTVFDKNRKSFSDIIKIIIMDKDEIPTDILFKNSRDRDIYVEENRNNFVLGHFHVLDEDRNEIYNIRIKSENFGIFFIQNNELLINASSSTDYEKRSEYLLNIEAVKDNLSMFNKTYFIHIKDVNELPTALFISNSKIPENALPNSVVGILSADDPDLKENSQIFIFELLTFNSTFYISNSELKLSSNANLDHEKVSLYNLTISVTDSGSPPQIAEFGIVIEIQDINEKPNDLILKGNEIIENMPIGTVIGTLTAEDPDRNSSFAYSIRGNDINFLILNDKLLTGKVLDFENQSIYDVEIMVTDNGFPMLNTSKIFRIFVIDQNESPEIILKEPNGNMTNTFFLVENNSPGIIIGEITVTDPDLKDFVTVSIIPDSLDFYVEKKTQAPGVSKYILLANVSTNYENVSQYKFSLIAADAKNLVQSTNVLILIQDINEPPTNLSIVGSNQSSISLMENVQGQILIASFIAMDQDQNDHFEYFIVKCQNCEGKFEFPNNMSKLFLKEHQYFNYEEFFGKEVKLVVKTVDTGGFSLELEVTINITDANDPPHIHGFQFTQIPRYTLQNAILGAVNVTDEDLVFQNNQISCSIINDINWLMIKQENNIPVVMTTESKYFNGTSIRLDIQCSDNGIPSLTSTLVNTIVKVINDENEPKIISFKWVLESIFENQSNVTLGEVMVQTQYSKILQDITFSNITFEASTNIQISLNENKFIVLTSALDYETLKQFTISFSLFQQENSQTISSTIKVVDVNEAPTEIKSNLNNLTVLEKSLPNIYITTIYVMDPDSNQNHFCNVINVLISKNSFSGEIPTNLKIVKLVDKKLLTDSESQYALNSKNVTGLRVDIECKDDGQPSFFITQQMLIQVLDINDAPYAIKFVSTLTSILENATVNTVLSTFIVEDEDIKDYHTCNISNPVFKIFNNSIMLNETLDYETSRHLETKIICVDKGGSNVAASWSILVEDVNEPPQKVLISNSRWNETLDPGTCLSTISAIDPEGSECHLILKSCENIQCPFDLLSNGSLILNQTLITIKETDVIRFNISASDNSGNMESFSIEAYIIRQHLVNVSIEFVNVIELIENLNMRTEIFGIQIKFNSEFTTNIFCEVFSSEDMLILNEMKVLLVKSLDYENSKSLSANVTCFQNKYQPVETKSITLSVINIDEPIQEIVINISKSIVEGNYSNEFIGNILVKDPELDKTSVKCVARNIELTFTNNDQCEIVTLKGLCELSFNVSVSGIFNYEVLKDGLNFSIECNDKISSITKSVSLIIEDKNEAPTDLIINGPLTVDLDTMTDGSTLGNLTVVDEETFQLHDIMIHAPGNKYFKIINNKEIVLQNLQFSWTGYLNCSITVTDNGIPPMNATFHKTFNFIKSRGDVIISNRIINATAKATTLIGQLSLQNPAFNEQLIFQLSTTPENAFDIKENALWLLKDADQFRFSTITVGIVVLNSFSREKVIETTIRLEINGFSICNSDRNTCHANATCKSTENSTNFQCSCKPGFDGDGFVCREIDECLSKPCHGDNSSCIDMINDFQCQCESNLSGKKCEILSKPQCQDQNCNHGICDNNNKCICISGWQGQYCNESFDDCAGNPCNGHGTCRDGINTFECFCLGNFSGIHCEIDLQFCNNCTSNEICINLANEMPYCLDYKHISTVTFKIDEKITENFTIYQNDFKEFLKGIDQFKQFTIYNKIQQVFPMNYQLNLTVIDEMKNILNNSQSLDVIKVHCQNTVPQSTERVMCSNIFGPIFKTGKQATNVTGYVQFPFLLIILQLINQYFHLI